MEITEPMPHVHNFSDGYYLVNGFFIEPAEEADAPQIQDHIYAYIQNEFYGDTQAPVLFRHNDTQYHFRIEPSSGVRSDTVELPYTVVDAMDLDQVPSEQQFLMAKPGHAKTIVELSNPDIGMN